jgi:hypothetical protein
MCDCVATINKKLADRNTRIAQAFCLTEDLSGADCIITIATEKVHPRGKRPVAVLATFCPFCGTEIPRSDAKTEGR